MSLDDYKNKKSLDEKKGSARGLRIEHDHISVMPSGKKKDILEFSEKINSNLVIKDDYLELHVYDENDNLLNSIYNQIDFDVVGTGGNKKLILKPGDTLRRNGYRYGDYRIVYNIFKELLGSRNGRKVYIEEISTSRTEIRILPVREKYADSLDQFDEKDLKFFDRFNSFSDGIDFDLSEYSEGKISTSADSLKSFIITGGSFTNDFKGRYLIVQNQNGDITYKTKIKTVVNPAKIIVETPYRVKGQATNLKNSSFTIIGDVKQNEIPKRDLKNLAVFDNNINYVISNWISDIDTHPDFPHSIIVKLYEPLPDNINVNDKFWIVREILRPVIESIHLDSEIDDEPTTLLRPPNFTDLSLYKNIPDLSAGDKMTQLESWDTLVSTDTNTSQKLVDHFFGSDIKSVDINLDYNYYENFIHYSSAEERLKNFKYKLKLIEGYTDTSASLVSLTAGSGYSASLEGKTEVYLVDKKIRNLKSGFDNYEKFLYYQSGSNSWPKSNTSKPFNLVSSTDGESITWYSEQLTSASTYDKANNDYLVNVIPQHVVEDEYNDQFVLFLDMIGQHFDTLWSYTKSLTRVNSRVDKLDEGMPKDLTYHIGKSMGWDFKSGNSMDTLWQYVLGTEETGSRAVSGLGAPPNNEDSLSKEDITKEVWKRIITNLPYLLKTKGTRRSVRALMACYGIPSSLIDIKEYGGPEPDSTKPSYFRKDIFSYMLTASGSGFVSSSWENYLGQSIKPHSIQARFRLTDTTDNQVIVQSSDPKEIGSSNYWALRINEITGSTKKGRVEFIVGDPNGTNFKLSSSLLPVADGEFYSTMVTREVSGSIEELASDTGSQDVLYRLYVKKYNRGKRDILYSSVTNDSIFGSSGTLNQMFTASAGLYIGGSGSYYGTDLSGSLQEFRLWNELLNEGVFNNYTKAPKSVNGKTWKSAYNKLALRYSFNKKKNHSSDNYVYDEKPNTQYAITGSAHLFTTDANHYGNTVDEHLFLYPNIGPNRVTNKTRVEDNSLVHGNLNTKKSVEKSAFDTAPLDSPKLGIYYSPTNIIDEDIIATFAGTSLDDFVGSPLDMYQDQYMDLKHARVEYFRKYDGKNNFKVYIDLLKYYDLSLFRQIKDLLPYRAHSTVGVLVEPTILERPKIKYKPIRTEEPNYDDSIDLNTQVEEGGEYRDEEAVIDINDVINPIAEETYHEAEVSSDSVIDMVGENSTIETAIPMDSILTVNKAELRESTIEQLGKASEGKILISNSIVPSSSFSVTGSNNDSITFIAGEGTDVTHAPNYATGSVRIVGTINEDSNNYISIIGSDGVTSIDFVCVTGSQNPYSASLTDTETIKYFVSGTDVNTTAQNLSNKIGEVFNEWMTGSSVTHTIHLTSSVLPPLIPPNYPIVEDSNGKGFQAIHGMGGGTISSSYFYYVSQSGHVTSSDDTGRNAVSKINSVLGSDWITSRFTSKYSGSENEGGTIASVRNQSSIILEGTQLNDNRNNPLVGSDSFTIDYGMIGGLQSQITTHTKIQLPTILPNVEADIEDSKVVSSEGEVSTEQDAIADASNVVLTSGENITLNDVEIDYYNDVNFNGDWSNLEGSVDSILSPKEKDYSEVLKDEEGNPRLGLVSGKVFQMVHKKQSEHFVIKVEESFTDSNHPSGSGFILMERTKFADVTPPSNSPLRRVYYEGIKMRSKTPANINVNPEVNSFDTVDGGPVVEVTTTTPTQVLVSEPGATNQIYVQ